MMNRVDTCGMSCPQPVLMAKNAVKSNPKAVEIIVDNNTAKGNVERFLNSAGYKVEFKQEEDLTIVIGKK